ncbi:MAG: MraY family glycosyltransferase [Candidatus Lernaella stagnicola]|nr:MraY family glycosyltransferase [Candidatus Lernaella stagnicola]
MLITGLAIATVFLISLLSLSFVTRVGYALGCADKQTIRNVHTAYTPRVGGIGIAIAMAAAIPVVAFVLSDFDLLRSRNLPVYLGIGTAAVLLFALGVVDDFRHVNHRWKFMFQILAAEIMVGTGTVITAFDFGALGVVHLGWMAAPVTVLFIIGLINAMNLVDGLDGLAAGISFAALAASVFLLSRAGEPNLAKGLFVIMIALVAFIAFNFHPARIFFGDAGSLLIGVCVAAGVIHAFRTSGGGIATPSFLLPVFIPLLDTSTAMARRFIAGMSLFGADRDHIHHRVYQRIGDQAKTVLILWTATSVLSAASVLMLIGHWWTYLLGVLGASAAVGFLVWISGVYVLFSPAYVRDRLLRHRGDNRRLRGTLAKLVTNLEKSESLWEVNHMLLSVVSMLGCSSFNITFTAGRGESTFSWVRSDHLARVNEELTYDVFPIRHNGQVLGHVQAGWVKSQLDGLFEKRLLTEQLADGLAASSCIVLEQQKQPAA